MRSAIIAPLVAVGLMPGCAAGASPTLSARELEDQLAVWIDRPRAMLLRSEVELGEGGRFDATLWFRGNSGETAEVRYGCNGTIVAGEGGAPRLGPTDCRQG